MDVLTEVFIMGNCYEDSVPSDLDVISSWLY